MKYAIAILFAAILAFSSAYGHNEQVTANAQFDVKVILPLSWEVSDVELPDVIAGQNRDVSEAMVFTVTGEKEYTVEVTELGDPTHDEVNTLGNVSLSGSWETGLAVGSTKDLDATNGQASFTYTVNNVAASSDAHGEYGFTLTMAVKYEGL
jgi:hypothetical protein